MNVYIDWSSKSLIWRSEFNTLFIIPWGLRVSNVYIHVCECKLNVYILWVYIVWVQSESIYRLEFEIAYLEATVQHFIHYATWTLCQQRIHKYIFMCVSPNCTLVYRFLIAPTVSDFFFVQFSILVPTGTIRNIWHQHNHSFKAVWRVQRSSTTSTLFLGKQVIALLPMGVRRGK